MISSLDVRRGWLAGSLLAVAACSAGTKAAPGGETAAPRSTNSAALASAAPATSRAAPKAPVSPAPEATMGDVTCKMDADCVIATRAECCDCCEANPKATSKSWLDWRDHTMCPAAKCAICEAVVCAGVEPAAAFHTECERGHVRPPPRTK